MKKSELIETNLQGGYVEMTKTKRLDKKMEMLMQKSQKNVDFKKKIEDLMMEKFMDSNKKSRIE